MEAIVSVISYVSVAAEGLAALVSILFYAKYRHTPLRYLPFLLSCIFILELTADTLYQAIGFRVVFYNILNTAFYIYFFYVYYHFLNNPLNKKIVIAGFVFFVIAILYDLINYNYIREQQIMSYLFGGFCIIVNVVLYFLEMLNSPRVLNIRQDLMFWIGVGLILFYVGYLPIKITRLAFYTEQNQYLYLYIIHHLLIIILYSSITAGLVWKRRN